MFLSCFCLSLCEKYVNIPLHKRTAREVGDGVYVVGYKSRVLEWLFLARRGLSPVRHWKRG